MNRRQVANGALIAATLLVGITLTIGASLNDDVSNVLEVLGFVAPVGIIVLVLLVRHRRRGSR